MYIVCTCKKMSNMFNLSYLALLIVIVNNAFLTGVNTQLQCRDEDNQPVDWFVIYKIPKIFESSNPLIKQGLAYAYITNNTANDGWEVSKKSIALKTSIPGYTLAPLYTKNDSVIWTLYNDQAPNEPGIPNYGHTKGVVMADVRQGLWLVHSVPHYPPAPNHGTDPPERSRRERSADSSKFQTDGEYDYPKTGRVYGQSYLCISVNADQFDLIGIQLMYNQIIPYKNNLPEKLAVEYPFLTKAANKIRVKDAPYNHKTFIRSLAGLEFLSFAKSDKWQRDLYDDFVAPQLRSDLLTETWPNSRGRLPSDCTGSKVINIKSINFEAANVVFTTTHDHSKWAVSRSGNKNSSWVCVGDINRAKAQMGRGGGTVCVNLEGIWKSYRFIVNDMEPCPKKFDVANMHTVP